LRLFSRWSDRLELKPQAHARRFRLVQWVLVFACLQALQQSRAAFLCDAAALIYVGDGAQMRIYDGQINAVAGIAINFSRRPQLSHGVTSFLFIGHTKLANAANGFLQLLTYSVIRS
jgi:hypothetical protein